MSSNEDDQLGELKDWWQRNGKPLLTGGLLALVVVSGAAGSMAVVIVALVVQHGVQYLLARLCCWPDC